MADSRIVAFSTGNVYPFVPVASGGATEDEPLMPAPGDYAASCIGRERVLRWYSETRGTPGLIYRLNYAIDLRYGVLHDVARKVRDGEPIDVTMGHVNVIWQGDANAIALRCLRHCTTPTEPLNVTGPETTSIRALAHAFAERFGTSATIVGEEAPTALLSDASRALELFGPPAVPVATLVEWQADWLARGMPTLGEADRLRGAGWLLLMRATRRSTSSAADDLDAAARPLGRGRLEPGCRRLALMLRLGRGFAVPGRRPARRDGARAALPARVRLGRAWCSCTRRTGGAASRRGCVERATAALARAGLVAVLDATPAGAGGVRAAWGSGPSGT